MHAPDLTLHVLVYCKNMQKQAHAMCCTACVIALVYTVLHVFAYVFADVFDAFNTALHWLHWTPNRRRFRALQASQSAAGTV